jgi:hypothetical protein
MKRSLFAVAAVVLITAGVGCHRQYMRGGSMAHYDGAMGCQDGSVTYGDGCVTCETGRARGGRCGCGLFGHGCSLFGHGCGLGGDGGGLCHGKHHPAINPGPPVAQVAYPYYTVRGPRDYFCDDPPTIGPR